MAVLYLFCAFISDKLRGKFAKEQRRQYIHPRNCSICRNKMESALEVRAPPPCEQLAEKYLQRCRTFFFYWAALFTIPWPWTARLKLQGGFLQSTPEGYSHGAKPKHGPNAMIDEESAGSLSSRPATPAKIREIGACDMKRIWPTFEASSSSSGARKLRFASEGDQELPRPGGITPIFCSAGGRNCCLPLLEIVPPPVIRVLT